MDYENLAMESAIWPWIDDELLSPQEYVSRAETEKVWDDYDD